MNRPGNIGERTTAGSGCSRTPAVTDVRHDGYGDELERLDHGAAVAFGDQVRSGAQTLGEAVGHVLCRLTEHIELSRRDREAFQPTANRGSMAIVIAFKAPNQFTSGMGERRGTTGEIHVPMALHQRSTATTIADAIISSRQPDTINRQQDYIDIERVALATRPTDDLGGLLGVNAMLVGHRDAQPIAAIANRIVERVRHGSGLHCLRDTQISHEAVALLVGEGADFAEGKSDEAVSYAIARPFIEPKASIAFIVYSDGTDATNRAYARTGAALPFAAANTQGQIPHLPIVSHSPLPIRNEASGDGWFNPTLIISVAMAADDLAAGCAGVDVVGRGEHGATGRVHALLMAMTRSDEAAPPASIPLLPKGLQLREGGHAAPARCSHTTAAMA